MKDSPSGLPLALFVAVLRPVIFVDVRPALTGCFRCDSSHGLGIREQSGTESQSMLKLKPFEELSGVDAGWLRAKHHFAIGPYGNPAHKAVGNLIVLNDDEIAPHRGFGLHQHENVEIVSYLREGTVTHRDDMGNVGKTHAGDVQVMSAGSGIRHSEQNEEDVAVAVRLFQIWLKPSAPGGIPRWGNKPFPKMDRADAFVQLASGRNAEGALPIRADAEVCGALLRDGSKASYSFRKGDAGYLVPATGEVEVGGVQVHAREGLVIENEEMIAIRALTDSELILVVIGNSPLNRLQSPARQM